MCVCSISIIILLYQCLYDCKIVAAAAAKKKTGRAAGRVLETRDIGQSGHDRLPRGCQLENVSGVQSR